MILFDAVSLGEPRLTRDGYLVADAKIARTGIQLYAGKEVDPENKQGWRDKALVRVYRPESEVFSTDAMASFAHKPITDDHPSEAVSSKNWKVHRHHLRPPGWRVGLAGDPQRRPGYLLRTGARRLPRRSTRQALPDHRRTHP